MTSPTAADERLDARRTYEAIAEIYDSLTAHHDYELWLGNLLPAAERLGLQGRRVLDLACGTGKSFLPLLASGNWEVTGCDISESMLAQAAEKAGGKVALRQADMRELPVLGSFDLVLCLGDAVNYLLSEEELESCFAGMQRNLAEGGVALFDTNTLLAYRTFYAEPLEHEIGGRRFVWHGNATPRTPAGSVVEGRLEIDPDDASAFVRGDGDDGADQRCLAVHRQRHFPAEEVREALARAGLECLAVYGHGYDAVLEQPLDELRHTKAIFIARPELS